MRIPTPRRRHAVFIAAALFLLSFRPVSANQTGKQKITVIGTDVTIEKIFKAIEKQTGLRFMYAVDALNVEEKVTVAFRNTQLDEVLSALLKQRGVSWQYSEGTISLKKGLESEKSPPQPAATVEVTQGVGVVEPPPTINIYGQVVDAKGTPIPGVTVLIKGTNKGAKTDGDGNFRLNNVDPDATILVRSIGFETKEVTAMSKKMVVKMKEVAGKLDETIIVGYQKTSPRYYTGTVSSVKAEDIEKQPVSDPLLALQGRVPGMTISQTTGLPGGKLNIQVRGINSINQGTQPLFIVDGVPYNPNLASPPNGIYGAVGETISALNFINPQDIESIDVLKDADATAIYGSRGANGVILITTKKGKIGDAKINVNINSGWNQLGKKLKLMNTQQYLKMRHEAFNNDNITPDVNNAPDLTVWDTTRYTDWQKVLVGATSHYTNASMDISGGTPAVQYLLGGTYNNQTPPFPGDFFSKRSDVHFNLSSTSSDGRFKASLTSSYAIANTNMPVFDFAQSMLLPPDAPKAYNDDGSLNWENSTWQNPFAQLISNVTEFKTTNLVSNVDLAYTILSGLVLKVNIGYNELRSNSFRGTTIAGVDPKYQALSTASSTTTYSTTSSWISEPQLTYDHRFGGHDISALLGATLLGNSVDNQLVGLFGINQDAQIRNPAAANSYYLTGTDTKYKYGAFFGRVGDILWDKYLLNFTARRDGSSRFGPRNRFATFWSVGAGWIFSQEELVHNAMSYISFGKLRASYGITGNDQIGDYQYFDQYSFVEQNYEGAKGLRPAGLYNPDYNWERTRKSELGLDLGFFEDRILITGSYYRTISNNQLLSYPVPVLTGFGNITGNLPATILNKGVEISVNSKNIQASNFDWSTSFNISFNKNKLLAYDLEKYGTSLKAGDPLTKKFLYQYVGVDPATGVFQFADIDGKLAGLPDPEHTSINVAPAFFGGFNNSFRYKRLQVDIFFQYIKQKGNVIAGMYDPGKPPGFIYNQFPDVLSRSWKGPGDVNATMQKLSSQDYSLYSSYGTWFTSDKAYGDASFIRCKNIALSWLLPENILKQTHLSNLRFYVQGQNLFTITGYPGWDPETQTITSIPPLRTIIAGLQVTF